FMGAYNAAKAAMASFVLSLQLELAGSDICVIDLQPADILTSFNNAVARTDGGDPRYTELVEHAWRMVEQNMQAAPKPELVARRIPIVGRPLISYAIDSFDKAGVETIHVVVGPNGDELAAAVAPLLPALMKFNPIPNQNWRKQNGVSVLAAAGKVRAPFFLAMGDHLFERSILDQLLAQPDPTRL